MYHSIDDNRTCETGAGLYCVPVNKFREQMEFIVKNRGVRGQPPRSGDRPLTPIPVITFDDGLEDNFTNAYPILKGLGLKAYFFVMPNKIGTKGYMNWAQIKELSKEGMIIGSHGMTHRILTNLKIDDLAFEAEESKKIIENKLNSPVEYFSAPKGYYDKTVISAIRKAGYKKMFTSDLDKNNAFTVGRIAVRAHWSEQYFKQVITRGLPLKARVADNIKRFTKKLIGNSFYHNLREIVLSRSERKQ